MCRNGRAHILVSWTELGVQTEYSQVGESNEIWEPALLLAFAIVPEELAAPFAKFRCEAENYEGYVQMHRFTNKHTCRFIE